MSYDFSQYEYAVTITAQNEVVINSVPKEGEGRRPSSTARNLTSVISKLEGLKSKELQKVVAFAKAFFDYQNEALKVANVLPDFSTDLQKCVIVLQKLGAIEKQENGLRQTVGGEYLDQLSLSIIGSCIPLEEMPSARTLSSYAVAGRFKGKDREVQEELLKVKGDLSKLSLESRGELILDGDTIKRLDFSTLAQEMSAQNLRDLHAAFPNLEELSLKGCKLSPDAVQELKKFSQLRQLDLSDCGLRNSDMQTITHLPHLQTLSIAKNSALTDVMAAVLSACPLKELDISNIALSLDGFLDVAKHKDLKSLKCTFIVPDQIHGKDALQAIKAMPHLLNLEFEIQTSVYGDIKPILKYEAKEEPKQVEWQYCNMGGYSNEQLELILQVIPEKMIPDIKKVVERIMSNAWGDPFKLSPFLLQFVKPFVEEIRFRDKMDLSAKDMRELATFPSLKSIDFSNSNLSDKLLFEIHAIPSLETCICSGTSITHVGAEQLFATFPYLTRVSFDHCPNISTSRLHVPSHIKDLDLSYTDLSDKELINWPQNRLETLHISGCSKVTEQGIQQLQASFPDLTALSAESCEAITDSVVAFFSPKLIHLTINHTQITVDGLKRLPKDLKTLLVRGFSFSDSDVEWLKAYDKLEDVAFSLGKDITKVGIEKVLKFAHLSSLGFDFTKGDGFISMQSKFGMLSLNELLTDAEKNALLALFSDEWIREKLERDIKWKERDLMPPQPAPPPPPVEEEPFL